MTHFQRTVREARRRAPGGGPGEGRKRRGDWRTKHLRACLLCGRSSTMTGCGSVGTSRSGRRRDRRRSPTRFSTDWGARLVWSGLPGGFRAGRRCWSCPSGAPSRDGTARLGRTVWSTTTNGKGRCVERQLECRGRLVWRTRRPWGRSVAVVAPDEPGGGALARADPSGWALTLGRARILRSVPATPGQLAERCGRQRNASSPMSRVSGSRGSKAGPPHASTAPPRGSRGYGSPTTVRLAKPKASRVTCWPPIPSSVSNSTMAPLRNGIQAPTAMPVTP